MLQIKDIKQVIRKTAETYGLVRVTLFGSFARGDAGEASDVDLLVETSRPLGFARRPSTTNLKASSIAPSTSCSVLITSIRP